MNQLPPNSHTQPVTDPHKERRVGNITVTHTFANTVVAEVPAFVTIHDNHYVAVSGRSLSDLLGAYYAAGFRRVEVVIDAAGQRLAAEAKVYRRFNRRSGRMYFWLYSLQLRSLCSATCSAGTAATLHTTPRGPCR
jgi:hypothetical protein